MSLQYDASGNLIDGFQLLGSNAANQPQKLRIENGAAAMYEAASVTQSWTTHNQTPLAGTFYGVPVFLTVTGYRKGTVLVNGDGTRNCLVQIHAVMRDGTTRVFIGQTTAGLSGKMDFDLNGLDKITVNIQNTDATIANTITANVFVTN